jgi:replication factor A1
VVNIKPNNRQKISFFFVLDVIGVVKSTSDMQTIISKASQKEFSKRELLLVDENASITATLWGQQVELFEEIFFLSFIY